jgi:hypothetical protein
MKDEEILSGLEKLLESLGVVLRYEKGDFTDRAGVAAGD